MVNSELFKFYRLSRADRCQRLAEMVGLQDLDLRRLSGEEGLLAEQANHMVENALGVMGLPLGVCVNLRINGRDRLAPMATEEPSVVAAASHAAKMLRAGGGITVQASLSLMEGQVQVLDLEDPDAAEAAIMAEQYGLLRLANRMDPCLVEAGGGARELRVRRLELPATEAAPARPMLVVQLLIDVRDAMGANAVNAMCEGIAPEVERITGGRVCLRILSNLADRRLVRATGCVPLHALQGKGGGGPRELALRIEEASLFAEVDPYRAATHNKGIMNGVDAVLLATGQDWRAVEAGAHAHAANAGRYTSMSRWRLRGENLEGRLEIPLAVGVVGGVTGSHPGVKTALKLAQIQGAADLAGLAAAVGLAQNLGALRALAAEGIQRGHMRVHLRNAALSAGATGKEVDRVALTLGGRHRACVGEARKVLAEVRRAEAGVALSEETLRRRVENLGQAFLPRIMAQLESVLKQDGPRGASLADLCTYHMQTGGKRLRALLPLLTAEVLGQDPAALIPFGAACEMLHNATLVHDDVQDGDRLRRGQETVWARFGMPQAINLGDAMFYYTILLLDRLDLPPARRQVITRRLLRATLLVIEGQQLEFRLATARRPTLEGYTAVVAGKTAGLLRLVLAGAAELCGAPAGLVSGLDQAALHLGILFQIQDDLLDLYGEKGRESRGSDIREGKRSVLAVHALEYAPPQQAARLRQILDLDRADTGEAEVEEARRIMEHAGSRVHAVEELVSRRDRALDAAGLEAHNGARSLVGYLASLFLRPLAGVVELPPQTGVLPLAANAGRGRAAAWRA